MDLPAADHDVVATAGDLLEDRVITSERITTLVHVGELHRRTDPQGPAVGRIRLCGPATGRCDDHPEQRRLARTVRPDDADDATRRQLEREIVDQETVAESLPEVLGLHHEVAEPRTVRDGHHQLLGATIGRFRLSHEGLVGVDARLALGLPCPRREADPLQLTSERALPSPVRLLLLREACFLLLQPGGVVAFPGNAATTVEFEDPARNVVEEVAVVSDGDDRTLVLPEEAFEPGHRLGVEVVGGFVEQQQIGSGQQEATQRDSAAFTAREHCDIRITRWEPQGIHRDVDRPLEIPSSRRFDLLLQLGLLLTQLLVVGVGIRPPRQHFVVAFEKSRGLTHAVHDVAEHVLVRIQLRLLVEQSGREARGQPGLAGVPVVLARHDPQQARLPGPVGPQHADLRARIERQIDVLEDLPVGRMKARKTAHGEDELMGHGPKVACRWRIDRAGRVRRTDEGTRR